MTMTNRSEADDATAFVPLVDLAADVSYHKQAVDDALNEVMKDAKFILGPQVAQLEKTLSDSLSTSSRRSTSLASPSQPLPSDSVQCIAVSDGTAALQLALMALGIGPGDEVITVPFTWISSAEVISLVGATPKFIDIDPNTYLVDSTHLSSMISERTKAVLFVSLFGRVPNWKSIREILSSTNFTTDIKIIEDGAQSFGAMDLNGALSCSSRYIDIGTTSFFPTKPFSCYGDGGAVFTRNETYATRIRSLRVHGKQNGKHHYIGLNSRLDTMQAAILLAKWPSFPGLLQRRRKVAKNYNELLKNQSHRIILPISDKVDSSAWAVYTIRILERDQVKAALSQAGIASAVYYPIPCHLQPCFNEQTTHQPSLSLPKAEVVAKTVLSLPIHPYLKPETQTRIVRKLCTILDDLCITQAPSFI